MALVLVAACVSVAGGVVVWRVVRDRGGSTVVAGGGHLRFRMPTGWHTSDCPSVSDECVQVGPPGAPGAVAVILERADPKAPEGNIGLLVFATGMGPDPAGLVRSRVDGFPSVRMPTSDMYMLQVLLDSAGDLAAVLCRGGTPTAGWRP